MKVLSSAYFRSINEMVNSAAYNQHSNNININIFNVNDLTFDCKSTINKIVEKNGFIILDLSKQNFNSLKCLEKWLQGIIGFDQISNSQFQPFTKIQSEEKAKYYVNSRLAQPMHTDEGYSISIPRYAALYCQSEAKYGGISTFLQVKNLYSYLERKFSKKILRLFEWDAVHVEGINGVITKPILLKLENDEIGISYTSILKSMKCAEEVYEMYNFISHFIHNVDHQIRFKLLPKHIVIFDNCKIMHGRTGFEHADGRLLYRFWFKPYKII